MVPNDEGGYTRVECGGEVMPGRPNGFLCAFHDSQIKVKRKKLLKPPTELQMIMTNMQREVDRAPVDALRLHDKGEV